jgi:hypothetical protein
MQQQRGESAGQAAWSLAVDRAFAPGFQFIEQRDDPVGQFPRCLITRPKLLSDLLPDGALCGLLARIMELALPSAPSLAHMVLKPFCLVDRNSALVTRHRPNQPLLLTERRRDEVGSYSQRAILRVRSKNRPAPDVSRPF